MNKYQEALNRLNQDDRYQVGNEKMILQELVDKATPKKPVYRIPDLVRPWGEKEKLPHCPSCDCQLSWHYGCSNNDCRQAIDWSKDD